MNRSLKLLIIVLGLNICIINIYLINHKSDYVTVDIGIPSITVLATKYHPIESQCDNDPLVTADGSKIDTKQLNAYKLRWIAVSRDLLDQFNYGDTILIDSDNKKLRGEWIIHDTMNKRYKNRIDFLVPVNDSYNFNYPIYVNITPKRRGV